MEGKLSPVRQKDRGEFLKESKRFTGTSRPALPDKGSATYAEWTAWRNTQPEVDAQHPDPNQAVRLNPPGTEQETRP